MYIFEKTEILESNTHQEEEKLEIVQPNLKIDDLRGTYNAKGNSFKAIKKNPDFLVTNLVKVQPGCEYVVSQSITNT